jgi:hypothetical protein
MFKSKIVKGMLENAKKNEYKHFQWLYIMIKGHGGRKKNSLQIFIASVVLEL